MNQSLFLNCQKHHKKLRSSQEIWQKYWRSEQHSQLQRKRKMIYFLRANQDVFTWKYEDMPGIDRNIIQHRLNINPECKPVLWKRRIFAPERNKVVTEEGEKLLEADFIREVFYPDWLVNMFMVKKSNGKWRMCVNFTDLNKACQKDSFPLLRIDQLVDSIAGHKLLSFMDAF